MTNERRCEYCTKEDVCFIVKGINELLDRTTWMIEKTFRDVLAQYCSEYKDMREKDTPLEKVEDKKKEEVEGF